MINNNNLEEMIRYVLYSSYLKGEKPVSLMIIAKPESGKTSSMLKFANKHNRGLILVSDLTYTGLVNLLPQFSTGELKTILIPDMLKIFGRGTQFTANLTTLLNEFVEEGIQSINTYANNVRFSEPVQGNFVSAITSTDFIKGLGYWGKIGFISRIVPFSYDYNQETVYKIFEYIISSKYQDEDPIKLKLPKMKKKITMSAEMASKLLPLSNRIGTEAKIFGFRIQKNLQILAKSCALYHGSDIVKQEHVDRIIHLSNWINLRFNPLE